MADNTKGVVAQSVGIFCLIEVRKGGTTARQKNRGLKAGIDFALTD
jgi:hypothetical protein